jgi:hypothetical protein
MGSRQIRGRKNAFGFQQLGVSFRAGGERKYRFLVVVEVEYGEHFAADRFISHPEDQVCAPLHGFDDVGQAQQVSP